MSKSSPNIFVKAGRTSRTRRSLALATATGLTVGLSLLASPSAMATLAGTTFEGNDGNLIHDSSVALGVGGTDWDNVTGRNTGVDIASGSGDNAYGQGTKEDNVAVTVVDGSIPPNKNDLSRFHEASELGANGHTYLYLGWERLVNIGNANLDFEINHQATAGFTAATVGPVTLNRTEGDLLVTYDFSGSGRPTLGLNRWLTAIPANNKSQCFSANALPCWGNHSVLSGGVAEGAVNTVPVPDTVGAAAPGSLGIGLFGEASIDLTAAGVFPAGTCQAFGSASLKSRSSSSFTAELKDFIAPVPVNIDNCGTITIHKVTENGDSSFGYTTTGGLVPATFSLPNGGTQSYNSVPAGTSSVTENLTSTQTGDGWTLKGVVCTTTGTGTSAARVTGTPSQVNITMAAGGNVDCTYTNHINLSPTIATKLSNTTANIGDKITDSSTLTSATATAGGTVTYSAYAGANTCSGTDLLNSAQTVTNGGVPDSAAFTALTAGSYSFQAVYSGDANNNPATSDCTTEQLLVKTNPSISTTLSSLTPVDVGTTVHDSSTLSGATSDAGGTVTYTVYSNSGCTLGAVGAGTKTVANSVVPDSNGIRFDTAGDYYWQAVYSGDTKNNGATSDCTLEHLVVNPLQPTVVTAQNLIPNDNMTLSGATSDAGGTITFNLYSPSDAKCTGDPALTQTVTVSGAGTYTTTNTAFLASTVGTWRWASSYSGDGNNLPASSACGVEKFTIDNG
jgi:hypothetical protein